AWLPSRRSTEHHSGAFSIRLLGQVRSGSSSGSGRNGRYFSKGIFFGVTGSGGIARSLSRSGRSGWVGWVSLGQMACAPAPGCRRKTQKPPGRNGTGGWASAYVGRSPLGKEKAGGLQAHRGNAAGAPVPASRPSRPDTPRGVSLARRDPPTPS